MNTSMFAMKHAHLSGLRLARRFTEPHGLTPARLDMLRVVLEAGGSILQLSMRHRLSVTKAVISVMVRSLEKLGLVTRERCEDDRRTFVVRLTEKAKSALRDIFYVTVVLGFLKLAFMGAFQTMSGVMHRHWELAMVRMEQRLQLFRRAFGIGTHNPWEVTEEDESFYWAEVPDNPNLIDMVPETFEVQRAREEEWARQPGTRKYRRMLRKLRAKQEREAQAEKAVTAGARRVNIEIR